jgi:hypothetical protein
MSEKELSNKETAEHIRKWFDSEHGPFAWPIDCCGYNQHNRFCDHRNCYWNGGSWNDWKWFCFDYADMIEKEES